jgi:hypothetical protein
MKNRGPGGAAASVQREAIRCTEVLEIGEGRGCAALPDRLQNHEFLINHPFSSSCLKDSQTREFSYHLTELVLFPNQVSNQMLQFAPKPVITIFALKAMQPFDGLG